MGESLFSNIFYTPKITKLGFLIFDRYCHHKTKIFDYTTKICRTKNLFPGPFRFCPLQKAKKWKLNCFHLKFLRLSKSYNITNFHNGQYFNASKTCLKNSNKIFKQNWYTFVHIKLIVIFVWNCPIHFETKRR